MDTLLLVVGSLVNAMILGFLVRRLIGTPIGWPRTIVLSLIVCAFINEALNAAVRGLGVGPTQDTRGAFVVVLICVLIVAWIMVAEVVLLVIAEVLVPTGVLPSPLQFLRELPRRRARSRRYLTIIAILARHGIVGYLRPRRRVESMPRLARAAREAMTDAGVTFVKLGQMLATRPDVVPPAFVAEFSQLHSAVPPVPWAEVAPVIEAELGRRVEEVFAELDPTPLAAASVAQIHPGRLLDGTEVVVKVQRPRARAQALADLDILDQLAARVERTTSWGRSMGVRALTDGFAHSLTEELDYTVELANMQAVAAASDAVRVPTPYPELSGPRLLVMERMRGRPLSESRDELAVRPLAERQQLANDLFTAVLRQVMVNGVFHADLHPGNIFVDEAGPLALLDLGSVGRLDRSSRQALGMLLLSAGRGDAIGATDALIELLERPAELDDRALERQVGQLVLRYGAGLGQGGSTQLFEDLISLVVRHRFAIPPGVAAAFRALAALEGSLRILSSDLDLVASARAQSTAMIEAQLEPEAIRGELRQQVGAWLPILQRLPRRLNKITEDLEDGRLGVSVRLFDRPQERAFFVSLINQVVLAVLAAALGLAGVLLVVSTAGPLAIGGLSLHSLMGAVLLLFSFVLGARVLVLVFQQQDLFVRNRQ